MNRSKSRRMRQVRRNRMIACMVVLIMFSFLVSFFFFKAVVTADQPSYKYYTDVRIGAHDTLWKIADRYMTDEYPSRDAYIREVKELNDLGNELVYGDIIMVPYYSDELK